jgi:hypothetical protein
MGACGVGAVLLAAQLAVAGFALAQAAPPPRPPRSHVVLISLDGLYPEIYRRSAELGLQMPHLGQLVREGASADGMLGIFPTATYPSHATLITGVRPARHGIVSNSVFTPARKLSQERPIAAGRDSGAAAAATTNAGTDAATGGESAWYWYADSLRAPCLPQVVTAAGYSVAVSNWPVLVGAPWVRWHLPEIWSLGKRRRVVAGQDAALGDARARRRGRKTLRTLDGRALRVGRAGRSNHRWSGHAAGIETAAAPARASRRGRPCAAPGRPQRASGAARLRRPPIARSAASSRLSTTRGCATARTSS